MPHDTLQAEPIGNLEHPFGAWRITNHGHKIGEVWRVENAWHAVDASDIPIPLPGGITSMPEAMEYMWLYIFHGAGR